MFTTRPDEVPRLALDSSAYGRFRSGDHRVHDLIAAAEVVLLPVVVLGELSAAFELGSRPRENRVMLSEFLAEPFVTVVPTTPSIGRQYGRVVADLRRASRLAVPANGLWIAASAIDQGATLLTFDSRLSAVDRLERVVLDVDEKDAELSSTADS